MCVCSHEMAVVCFQQKPPPVLEHCFFFFFFLTLDCVKLEKKHKFNIWKYNHKQLNRGAIYPLYPILKKSRYIELPMYHLFFADKSVKPCS